MNLPVRQVNAAQKHKDSKQGPAALLQPFEHGASVFHRFPGSEGMPLPSNLLAAPSAALEVPPCQGNEDESVNMFGKPAESHVRLEHDDAVVNGDRING